MSEIKQTSSFFPEWAEIFSCPHYVPSLLEVCKRKNISLNFKHDLIEIRGDKKEAVFKNLDTNQEVVEPYDFLHVTPPMGPLSFIANSPLADAAGWVAVNKETLRSEKFNNVYALGDCSSLPTSKTAAAISSQAPVLVSNLLTNDSQTYNGYTSCPLTTGKNKLILAEFTGYDLKPRETFWFDQRQESKFLYALKVNIFPILYWGGSLTGLWRGPDKSLTLLKWLKSILGKKETAA